MGELMANNYDGRFFDQM